MPKISEDDYRACILDPNLEKLGYPYRNREFVSRGASNRFKVYDGECEPDYIFYIKNRPVLDVEAKPYENQFDAVYGQATFYAQNFPAGVVPYIICAAGSKIKMYKAVSAQGGLRAEFQELPRLLTWSELVKEVENALQIRSPEIVQETILGSEQLGDYFRELFSALAQSGRPKFKDDDEIVLIVNEILTATLNNKNRQEIYKKRNFSKKVVNRLEEVLGWYDLGEIEGRTLAYAYREFVTANFTGKGYGVVDREIGRYLTPAPIIEFMVKLAKPKPQDKIIDFACGSGGFLGGVLGCLGERIDQQKFLKKNLFACDVDLFSVSTAKTFLNLLLPGRQENLNIFHHNGLWSERIHSWEKEDIRSLISSGSFDLVISNPPGGADYNLNYEKHLKKKLPLVLEGRKLQNTPLFIQRAIQLVKSGGKICLVVPDGILANTQLQYLRDYILENCRLKAIISLPRVFPNAPSKMSILYMRKTRPDKDKKVFMASVRTGIDPETKKEYNLETELNEIYEKYKKFER